MSKVDWPLSDESGIETGDLSWGLKRKCKDAVKILCNNIQIYALDKGIPVSKLPISRLKYLMIVKDAANYHFIFIDKPGITTKIFSDMPQLSKLELENLKHQITMEVGEIVWFFSMAISIIESSDDMLESEMENLSRKYVDDIIAEEDAAITLENQYISMPSDIVQSCNKFRSDYPEGSKTAFIMMDFEKTRLHNKIVKEIKEILEKYGIQGLRSDDKHYSGDLLLNVKTYMHCCDFGIAVFERLTKDVFNPNISFEAGYMMALRKAICILKDSTLKHLQTDLIGALYQPFDTQHVKATIGKELEKWLTDNSYI